MIIQTFRAPTFQEACAQIKATMGPKAFIIKHDCVRENSVWGWLLGRVEYEVVAAKLDGAAARSTGVRASRATDRPRSTRRGRRGSDPRAGRARRNTLVDEPTSPLLPVTERDTNAELPAAAAPLDTTLETVVPQPVAALATTAPAEKASESSGKAAAEAGETSSPVQTGTVADVTRQVPVVVTTDSALASPVETAAAESGSSQGLPVDTETAAVETTAATAPPAPELAAIKTQMAQMQALMQQFLTVQQERDKRLDEIEKKVDPTAPVTDTSRSAQAVSAATAGEHASFASAVLGVDGVPAASTDESAAVPSAEGDGASTMVPPTPIRRTTASSTPAAVREIISSMRRAEFEAPVIAAVRGHLFEVMDETALASPAAVRECVAEFLAGRVGSTGGLKLHREEKGKCVALVGPTGVGKTTTLAKLAAGLKFNFGLDVGFITIDTYRVAACDQLAQYGKIIDVPVHIAFEPKDVRMGLEAYADKDVILIDTVGRNAKNQSEIEDIKRFLECGRPVETHLLLSANSKSSELKKDLANFKTLDYGQAIVSKVDEAASLGTVLSVLIDTETSLSYITTGQNVPDDINVVDPRKLADLALTFDDGDERLVA